MPDKLLVLGSASGEPSKNRFSSAYALTVAGKLFLIDCGAPVSMLLQRYKFDPNEVQAVFLSHWHMSHIANLGLFLVHNNLQKRPHKLHVYGPYGTRGKIERLLEDSFLLVDDLRYKLDITNIKCDKKYKEALLQITYFKTEHLEKSKLKTEFGRTAISCGMVLNGPGWRIVYSGDLRSPKELTPYVKKCDLLIHEMSTHSPKDIADFATSAKIPNLLISHIGQEYDENPKKIIKAFAGRYSGNLIIAEDGTTVELNRLTKKRN